MVAEPRRHGDDFGDLVRRIALVDVAQRLVVQVLDRVAVVGQQVRDPVRALDRPPVMRDQDLRAERLQPVEPARPGHRVAKPGAAQRIHVGEGFVDRIGRQQHPGVGQPDRALVFGFRGDEVDLEPDAAGLAGIGLVEGHRRRDEGAPAGALRRAEPGADGAGLADREPHAELVHRAAPEDRGDQPHVPRHMADEVLLGDDLDPARRHVVGRHERRRAAHVIGVEMGVDDRPDRLVGDLAELGGDDLGVVHAGHGVDQDAGLLALDQRAVDDRVAEGAVDRAVEGIDPGLHRGLVAREVRVDRRGDFAHLSAIRAAGRTACRAPCDCRSGLWRRVALGKRSGFAPPPPASDSRAHAPNRGSGRPRTPTSNANTEPASGCFHSASSVSGKVALVT